MTVTYHGGRRIQGLEEDRIGVTASQGNNGGAGLGGNNTNTGGGGGGGAGVAGANAANSAGGNGGNGLQSDITGTNTYYAGGGGGGTWANISGDPPGGTGGLGGGGNGGEMFDNPGTQTAGTANTGGGGGAAGSTDTTTKAGGTGVVILQFTTSGTSYSTTGSPTVDTSSVSGKTILKYTGSGTFVLSSGSPDVRYLVVGGGGGGAGTAGGGGGAGGFLTGTKSSLASGTYTVTVGDGGAGFSSSTGTQLGSNGENSSFAGVVASGGGGGANNNSSAPAGADGGSGGGGGGRYGGAGGSTVDGTTVSAISPNAQVGSRFEETDTRKMYNAQDITGSDFSLTGLKGYYKFDEASGNFINNATSAGSTDAWSNDITTTGSPTYQQSGIIDYSLHMTGISGTTSPSFNWTTEDWSVSVWGKITAGAGTGVYRGLVTTRYVSSGTSASEWWSLGTNNNGKIAYETGGGTYKLFETGSDFDGQGWSHFVLTYDASEDELKFYLDGVLKDTHTTSTLGSTSNLLGIGQWSGNNANVWNGNIDELSIWNKVLNQTEITSLYNSGAGKLISTTTQWKEIGA